MDRETILLLVGLLIGAVIVWLLFQHPAQRLPSPKPQVEGADYVTELSWSRIPHEPRVTPRPLIEYPNAASTRPLIKAPSELEEKATAVLARPLIEYANSALSTMLEALPSALVALPRPLIEYANSGAAFALEPLTGADFSHVQPRPLVEFADGGWVTSLSLPLGLLREEGEGKK